MTALELLDYVQNKSIEVEELICKGSYKEAAWILILMSGKCFDKSQEKRR